MTPALLAHVRRTLNGDVAFLKRRLETAGSCGERKDLLSALETTRESLETTRELLMTPVEYLEARHETVHLPQATGRVPRRAKVVKVVGAVFSVRAHGWRTITDGR